VTMPDWNAIKSEYITTGISYRKLAEKRGVSFRTLGDRAMREKWTEERNKYRDSVGKRTVQKVREKTASSAAKKLVKLQQAADSLADVIDGVFEDADQFHRHIIQTRDGDTWDADCRTMEKVDTKAIKDLTGALKDLAYVMRNIYDIPTVQEQTAMDMAAKRLQLDQQKADLGDADEDNTGVVELAPVEKGADDA